jgi:hypothetical protein
MGTKPPLSSTKSAKAGGSESPPADSPMSRFRDAARVVANAPREKVLEAERRVKSQRKKEKR